MDHHDRITLCLTIGKRPEELRQTLTSLLALYPFKHIIAINDFGDRETSEVFKALCPQGMLIDLGHQVGHHRAIDEMYRYVKTPYIFHGEDDWLFDGLPDLEKVFQLLEQREIVGVCLRKISDFSFGDEDLKRIEGFESQGLKLARLTALHEQWYGFTFNPSIIKRETYQAIAPLSRFQKERHLSRLFRQEGRYVAYFQEGFCSHIGFESVANQPKVGWRKWWAKIFG